MHHSQHSLTPVSRSKLTSNATQSKSKTIIDKTVTIFEVVSRIVHIQFSFACYALWSHDSQTKWHKLATNHMTREESSWSEFTMLQHSYEDNDWGSKSSSYSNHVQVDLAWWLASKVQEKYLTQSSATLQSCLLKLQFDQLPNPIETTSKAVLPSQRSIQLKLCWGISNSRTFRGHCQRILRKLSIPLSTGAII